MSHLTRIPTTIATAITVCLCTAAVLRAADGDRSSDRSDVWRHAVAIQGGLPLLDVWIGRDGPWRFALDTGAEGSTVSRELAIRLNLPVLGALEQHTVNGVGRTALVRVAELTLGREGPVTSADAGVSDLAAIRQVAPGLDGVLGSDVLSGFDYVIDYQASRLTLVRGEGEGPSTRGGVELPLRFDRHRPVVLWPMPQGPLGAAPMPLVLDTGASALVVDALEADRFPCIANTSESVLLETHTGRRTVQSCQAGALRVGPGRLTGLRLVATPWPTGIERLDRGLLPASAFARVYVSTRRNSLVVWPR
jgi:predicted aspartyl protease